MPKLKGSAGSGGPKPGVVPNPKAPKPADNPGPDPKPSGSGAALESEDPNSGSGLAPDAKPADPQSKPPVKPEAESEPPAKPEAQSEPPANPAKKKPNSIKAPGLVGTFSEGFEGSSSVTYFDSEGETFMPKKDSSVQKIWKWLGWDEDGWGNYVEVTTGEVILVPNFSFLANLS